MVAVCCGGKSTHLMAARKPKERGGSHSPIQGQRPKSLSLGPRPKARPPHHGAPWAPASTTRLWGALRPEPHGGRSGGGCPCPAPESPWPCSPRHLLEGSAGCAVAAAPGPGPPQGPRERASSPLQGQTDPTAHLQLGEAAPEGRWPPWDEARTGVHRRGRRLGWTGARGGGLGLGGGCEPQAPESCSALLSTRVPGPGLQVKCPVA